MDLRGGQSGKGLSYKAVNVLADLILHSSSNRCLRQMITRFKFVVTAADDIHDSESSMVFRIQAAEVSSCKLKAIVAPSFRGKLNTQMEIREIPN